MVWFSYFGNRLLPPGLPKISIAGKTPQPFDGIVYKKLAPKYEWWRQWKEDASLGNMWYVKKYNETVLDKLDFHETLDELNGLARGGDFCMLCYEKPSEDTREWFCHRRIVSAWFNANGVPTKEYDFKKK